MNRIEDFIHRRAAKQARSNLNLAVYAANNPTRVLIEKWVTNLVLWGGLLYGFRSDVSNDGWILLLICLILGAMLVRAAFNAFWPDNPEPGTTVTYKAKS